MSLTIIQVNMLNRKREERSIHTALCRPCFIFLGSLVAGISIVNKALGGGVFALGLLVMAVWFNFRRREIQKEISLLEAREMASEMIGFKTKV